ncbi:putative cytoplasmic protein, partial [hydrothermal vent metagenome]
MNSQEKALARKLFKLKLHEASGQAFEDIFTDIMNYAEADFQSIKPWGNIGDRKNDGYIRSKNIFFQVFAPEEITRSYPHVVKKLIIDFKGLFNQWSPIDEFYFVLNDKYKGINADCEQTIQAIKQKYGLKKAGFKTAADLENLLFSLDEDQILSVVGYLPDPAAIKLDYSVLNEIISHLMGLALPKTQDSPVIYPDWDKKITFNNLGSLEARYLNDGFFQIGSLDEYLDNQSNFFADEVKDKVREIYIECGKRYSGNDLFWEIVNTISTKPE